MDGKESSARGVSQSSLMTVPPLPSVSQPIVHGQKNAPRTVGPNQWIKVTDPMNPQTTTMLEPQYVGTSVPTGKKSDQGKSRVDLLDPKFLLAMGDVLRFGAEKYAPHNWRGGIHVSRLIGAALRHLLAICRGEDIDPESGMPHSAHLGCTVMFLHAMLKYRPDLDDRWNYENHGWTENARKDSPVGERILSEK